VKDIKHVVVLYVEVQPTFPQNFKESKMSSYADNDIVSLNFRYHRNAENINIIFALEISKDKKFSDLENGVRKRLGPIEHNDFLRKIYPDYANRRYAFFLF